MSSVSGNITLRRLWIYCRPTFRLYTRLHSVTYSLLRSASSKLRTTDFYLHVFATSLIQWGSLLIRRSDISPELFQELCLDLISPGIYLLEEGEISWRFPDSCSLWDWQGFWVGNNSNLPLWLREESSVSERRKMLWFGWRRKVWKEEILWIEKKAITRPRRNYDSIWEWDLQCERLGNG